MIPEFKRNIFITRNGKDHFVLGYNKDYERRKKQESNKEEKGEITRLEAGSGVDKEYFPTLLIQCFSKCPISVSCSLSYPFSTSHKQILIIVCNDYASSSLLCLQDKHFDLR
ncbi:hypothetical protein TNCT_267631 [Trichonephila clavata]|uniref:Uncharacterized protein n=1 Tax=Trichonephila clavata TaxID=2740835 RepID=A0A8X6FIK0_TRICU|nr:hypothetical protein TNCT_267631 [Trichonephila clavata]